MRNKERLRSIDAYGIYNAVKLHFTKDSYDAKKYNFKTRVNEQSFLKRRDKYQFGKLAREYQYHNQLVMACVASFVYSDKIAWPGDILAVSEDCINQLKKNVQSLMYVFENDIKFISEVMESENLSFKDCIYNSADIPLVYKLMMNGKITMETLAILETETKMLSKILANDITSMIAGDKCLKVKKYAGFIQYDKTKIANIIIDNVNHRCG